MDERMMQLRLGAAVLASLVIVVIMLMFLGTKKSLLSSSYHIYIHLVDAPGVVEHTPIYQSGILIGRVKNVKLTESGVLITANIFSEYTIYHDQQCHLSTTLLGDASLKMVQIPREIGQKPLPHDPVKPGDTLNGRVAFDPVVLIGKLQDRLSTAITDVSNAATQLDHVAGAANEMIQENRQNVKTMIQNTSSLITDSHGFVQEMSGLINDDELQESFRSTIVRLPASLDKLDATVESIRTNMGNASERLNGTMEQFSARMDTSLDLADKALQNVVKITDPIAMKTEIWLGNVDNILQNLDVFTSSIINQEGTVGLLLRDRAIYDRLFQTLDRVNYLTKKLEPIVFNAQVFSEKIAQHPELLGVRGALFPDTGTSKSVPQPRGMNYSAGSGFPWFRQENINAGSGINTDFYNGTSENSFSGGTWKETGARAHSVTRDSSYGNTVKGRRLKPAAARTEYSLGGEANIYNDGDSYYAATEPMGRPVQEFPQGNIRVLSDTPVTPGEVIPYPPAGVGVRQYSPRLKMAAPSGVNYPVRNTGI
ncbi:MAG: hypothetical protein Q4C96_10870 [Planctomycetia bacterium]|nr:hypothetical protein [Planctomycetia bacterium]